MKKTNLKNYKGVPLKEWILKEQHNDYFILTDPNSSEILNYPKSQFENEKENDGASRQGDTFYIPTRK
jgi:hypothetical protein